MLPTIRALASSKWGTIDIIHEKNGFMATLTRKSDQCSVLLGGTTTIGRNAGCDITLSDPQISGVHARISFRRGVWSIDDLKSRNGTLVNGVRLTKEHPLADGDIITIGVNRQEWVVDDVAPPLLFARSSHDVVVTGDELLAIPDDHNPVVSVYQRPDGHWVAERAGEVVEVEDGHDIGIDGVSWRLYIPDAAGETLENIELSATADDLSLHFSVSGDEEHVELEARVGGKRYDLKARAHHYVLLTLARARIEDARDPELPNTAHGWVYQDDLSRMLGQDDNAIYLAVFRARKQLKAAGVARAASLVERRPGTRQLRIGISDLHVTSI